MNTNDNRRKWAAPLAIASALIAIFSFVYANARDPWRLNELEKLSKDHDSRIRAIELNLTQIRTQLDSIQSSINRMESYLLRQRNDSPFN